MHACTGVQGLVARIRPSTFAANSKVHQPSTRTTPPPEVGRGEVEVIWILRVSSVPAEGEVHDTGAVHDLRRGSKTGNRWAFTQLLGGRAHGQARQLCRRQVGFHPAARDVPPCGQTVFTAEQFSLLKKPSPNQTRRFHTKLKREPSALSGRWARDARGRQFPLPFSRVFTRRKGPTSCKDFSTSKKGQTSEGFHPRMLTIFTAI